MKNISNDDKYIIPQESLNVVFSVMYIGISRINKSFI